MPPKQLSSFCNRCSGTTNHTKLHELIQEWAGNHDGFGYEYSKTTSLLQCKGCEEVTLRVDHWHSEYDAIDETEYYPPRISRRPPKWEKDLPYEWRKMLREIYTALHSNSRRLAMMGARALVDMYMNDTIGDIGHFTEKLSKLASDGHLGSQDKEILKAALEAGHAASHRGHIPNSDEINHTMDIVENLLQKYPLQKSAVELQKQTPKRVRKKQP
ncbi:DUF4145 domain-containing protein [Pseudomonas sp. S9]|uniref:DUF4145 domain-containing protein n=1 Tax=Pseudomonas sp. S9 TaxID=686578 RepID=UPI0002557005|nr:DUF4145 domain-containing protein [Pseudomonas sp. S9]